MNNGMNQEEGAAPVEEKKPEGMPMEGGAMPPTEGDDEPKKEEKQW